MSPPARLPTLTGMSQDPSLPSHVASLRTGVPAWGKLLVGVLLAAAVARFLSSERVGGDRRQSSVGAVPTWAQLGRVDRLWRERR